MIFNSVTYLCVFLPLVFTLYWLGGLRTRLWIILIASLSFYGFWRIEFIPLMLLSAVVDYFLGLGISRSDNHRIRKRLLMTSVVVNVGILVFFKYLIFFRDTLWSIAEVVGYKPDYVELHIILPLGISFYVFQTMSYTIDVYRREMKPESDLLTYLCFVTFFPQLVAGPILRARYMLPQLRQKTKLKLENIYIGLQRIIAGLFLKVVMADTIATFVDDGFQNSAALLSGLDSWTLAYLFGFQIYFDFAGYSAIAIGSARLFGYTMPENFNFPYVAASPREFWQRWHISLSTWIRDYLYLPMIGAYNHQLPTEKGGGAVQRTDQPKSSFRRNSGLYLTWGTMGLWHGASWTFVLWGLYHALIISVYRVLKLSESKAFSFIAKSPVLSIAITMPFMMASWIVFRAASVSDALTIWGHMVNPFAYDRLGLSPNSYLLAAFVLFGFLLCYLWDKLVAEKFDMSGIWCLPLKVAYHTVTIIFVFVFLQVKQQFIYFQF